MNSNRTSRPLFSNCTPGSRMKMSNYLNYYHLLTRTLNISQDNNTTSLLVQIPQAETTDGIQTSAPASQDNLPVSADIAGDSHVSWSCWPCFLGYLKRYMGPAGHLMYRLKMDKPQGCLVILVTSPQEKKIILCGSASKTLVASQVELVRLRMIIFGRVSINMTLTSWGSQRPMWTGTTSPKQTDCTTEPNTGGETPT